VKNVVSAMGYLFVMMAFKAIATQLLSGQGGGGGGGGGGRMSESLLPSYFRI